MTPEQLVPLLVFGYIIIAVVFGFILAKEKWEDWDELFVVLAGFGWPITIILALLYKVLRRPILWLFK